MAKNKGLQDIISGGGATFITLIAAYLMAFFYKLIIARHYGPEDYGLFEMTLTILGFLTIFGSLGFANGIPRFISLYKHKNKVFLS
ncbi:MAG: oligosaccharide flippase family protein, partial [archaeon]